METVEVPSGTILVTWDSNLKGQGGGGGPRPNILFYAIFVQGKQSLQDQKILILAGSIYIQLPCNYLKF